MIRPIMRSRYRPVTISSRSLARYSSIDLPAIGVAARKSSRIIAILRTTRSRSTTSRGAGLGDEATLEVEIPPMVLIAFERVRLQSAKFHLGPVKQATMIGHLFQEERVGVVEHREIDLPGGEEALEVVLQLRALPQAH